jgi:hypothetical protein
MRKIVFLFFILFSTTTHANFISTAESIPSYSVGIIGKAVGALLTKKSVSKVHDYSNGRTFATLPKQKDPSSRRSSLFGPKKD